MRGADRNYLFLWDTGDMPKYCLYDFEKLDALNFISIYGGDEQIKFIN